VTHQMNKNNHQVNTSTSTTRAVNQDGSIASNGVPSNMEDGDDSPQAALAAVGMETAEEGGASGDNGDSEEGQEETPRPETPFDENEEEVEPFDEEENAASAAADTVPMSHVIPVADDVSSLQHTNMEPDQSSYAKEQPPEDDMVMIDEEEMEYYYDDAEQQKALQRRNLLIIIMLVIFLGLVVAIGVGVAMAVKNDPTPESAKKEENDGEAASEPDEGQYAVSEGGVDNAVDQFETFVPSTSPSNEGPCIPIEIGILFDQYSDETGWMLVKGNYFPEDPKKNVIVWESKYYNPLAYAKEPAAFDKCFSPGYYTFVFTDKEGDGICCYHGEGSYVVSSEGKVITIGGEMNSNEESVVFELPYVEPEPVDKDGDGRDDRLGWMMPYDSSNSNFTEGVDCENFRLAILTDEYGIETTWELYEGQDKAGALIANGGPYGSEYTYVVDYCLESPKEYVLYVYGELCCQTGEGWYRLTSGDIVIRDSDGQFGEVNITQFLLPADGSVNITDEPTPMPSTLEPKMTMKPSTSPTPPLPTRSPTLPPTRPDRLDTGGISWISNALAEDEKGKGEKEPVKRREERMLI